MSQSPEAGVAESGVFSCCPDPLLITDEHGTLLELNPACEETLGLTPRARGGAVTTLVRPADHARMTAALTQARDGVTAEVCAVFDVAGSARSMRWRIRKMPAGRFIWSGREEPHSLDEVGRSLKTTLGPILQQLPAECFMLDREGVLRVFFGNHGRSFGGHPVDTLVGRSVWDMVRAFPDAVAVLRAALAGQEGYVRLQSEKQAAHLAVAPLRLHDQVVGAVGISLDISQARASEVTARKLAEQLSMVVNHAPIILFSADAQGIITLSEGAGLAALGLQPGQLVGQSLRELYADQAEGLRCLDRVLAGVPASVEIHLAGRVMHVTGQPLLGPGGVEGVIAVAVDVTATREARDAAERLGLVMQSATDGLWETDVATGTTIFADEAMRRMGHDPDKLVGTDLTHLVHPEDIPKIEAALAGLPPDHNRVELEGRVLHGDGSYRWMVMRIHAQRDAHGALVRLFGVNTDITDRKETEERLRYQNALLHAQREASPDAILVVSNDGRVTNHNRHFRQMWSLRPEVLAAGDHAVMEALQEMLLEPEAFRVGLQKVAAQPDLRLHDELVLKDGRVLDRYSAPVRDDDGNHHGRIWTFRDVSESVRARRAVVESERFLRSVVDAIPAAVAVMRDGTPLLANRSALQLHGPQGVLADLLGAARSSVHGVADQVIHLHGSGTRWFQSRVVPIHPPEGGDALLLVAEDVTGLRQVETAFARSETQFRAVLDQIPVVVAIHRQGRFIYCNTEMASLLRYSSPGEFLGRSLLEFVHPDEHEEAVRRAREAVSGSRMPLRVTRFLRRDGTVGLAETTTMGIEFDGAPASLIFARDITEQREIEQKLALSDRMASVGTLAAGVAHEINNPLAFVLANVNYALEQLRELPATAALADLVQGLEDARTGGERVRRIVQDLKIFSRHDVDERTGPVAVCAVIESSISMAQNEIRHRAQLVRDYHDVPPVLASESRLGQVMLNLLVNAAQSIPEGAVDRNRITVTTRTGAGKAIIEVRDTGCGIPAETLPRIFDPFFTTKAVGVGTGLGLPICHGIVTRLGGDLTVESQPGKGSCFRVILPAAQQPPVVAAPTGVVAAPPPHARVLVVDDEPAVGAALKRMLGREHVVDAVGSGAEALSLCTAGRRFDAILCDLMMPEMTGMELHERLRALDPAQAARMVFITGGAFTARSREFLERRVAPTVEKPFDDHTLRDALRRVLTAA
ncbi:MAG: PAS domain S-box protein [Myxococcota bacterium]